MKRKIFLVIVILHNSETTCDRRKLIVNMESTSKNTSINRKNK